MGVQDNISKLREDRGFFKGSNLEWGKGKGICFTSVLYLHIIQWAVSYESALLSNAKHSGDPKYFFSHSHLEVIHMLSYLGEKCHGSYGSMRFSFFGWIPYFWKCHGSYGSMRFLFYLLGILLEMSGTSPMTPLEEIPCPIEKLPALKLINISWLIREDI